MNYSRYDAHFRYLELHNHSNLVLDDAHHYRNEDNDNDDGDDVPNMGHNILHIPNMECRMGRTMDYRSHRNTGRNTLLTNHIRHNKNHTNHTYYDSNSNLKSNMVHNNMGYSNNNYSNPCMDSCSFQLSRCYCH